MSEPVRPSREELLAYAVGKLSDADSQRVAAFVESDPECQAVLATLDGTEDTLVGRLRLPPVDDPYEAESQCDAALARARDAAALEARSAESLELGTLGEYELLERLGQGGMGTVYKALHTKLDRVVALKVIASHRMHERQAVARFEREMKAIGRLDHPAIVHAMDAREIDGVPVLVMEYVDGMDLGRLVRRHGPIAMADACELIRRAALALEAAHQHGLVHRDVKPSNLMLSRSGQVKLLDLGLARLGAEPPIESDSSTSSANPSTPMRPVDDQTGLTATGQAMGTADYMAPEQVSDPQSVDIRADIYSLGCTLYKLLTGRAPFDGTDCGGTLDKLEAHTDRPAPPIAERVADLPPGLADTIDRMLSKSPDDRPPTPSAVAELLAPHCEGHDLPALLHRAETSPTPRRAPLPCPTPRPAASGRRWKPITAMIGLMLLSGGLGMALGVLVIIKYRDTEMAVNVPDGAKVDIGKDGQVKVDVQPSAPKTFASAPKTYEKKESDSETALSESDPFGPVPKLNEEALQGTWVVERYLNASGRTWLIEPIQPPATNEIRQQAAKTARITITGNTFDVRGKDVWRLSGRLQINPEESPALINIEQASGGLLTGICKLEGDRLTLCVVEDGPGYSTRPKDFWAPFGSTKELLVLKRINKAEIHPDEEALQGTWHVARVSVSGRKKQGMYHVAKTGEKVTGGLELFRPLAISLSETPTVDFGKSTVSFFDRERRGHLLRRYAIDPTADPATIDIDASLYVVGGPGDIVVGVRAVPGSFRGIYCMDGEKLIARFSVSPRDGGPPKPRPSGFDTKLTGDQFEWVLSRKKPAGKPEVVLRRETTRAQPPAPMPSVPQKQNSRVAATPPRTTLAPKPLKRTTPLLEPPSREAIQGTWAVESYSNASSGTWLIHPSGPWLGGSPVTDEGWRKIIQDAAKTAKIVITGDTFKVRGRTLPACRVDIRPIRNRIRPGSTSSVVRGSPCWVSTNSPTIV